METKIKILLAEDEPSLGQLIKESLITHNFEVILCPNGEEASKKYKSDEPDILVLDVMMPIKDGFTLAKEIRTENETIPILFLTAKSQVKDVVQGFEIGGNDYLKKPFSMEELIVRINALLKRQKSRNKPIKIGNYIFDFQKQELFFENSKVQLTHRESQLLWHLYIQKNQILERSIILKKLWGDDDFFNARSMDVFISKLRKKLKQDPAIQIINIRGFGYKMIC